MGGDRARIAPARDGAFLLQTWGVGLLKLFDNRTGRGIRLRAEVRHDTSTDYGELGLYFAHQTYQRAGSPVHLFAQVEFNDIIDAVDVWRKAVAAGANPPPPQPQGNLLTLQTRCYAREAPKPLGD